MKKITILVAALLIGGVAIAEKKCCKKGAEAKGKACCKKEAKAVAVADASVDGPAITVTNANGGVSAASAAPAKACCKKGTASKGCGKKEGAVEAAAKVVEAPSRK